MGRGADILAKVLISTPASSAEIRKALSAQIRARSLFSARTPSLRHLANLKEILEKFADGEISEPAALAAMRGSGLALGYTPAGGFPGEAATPPAQAGGLKDLLSPKRTRLVLETNVRLCRSARQQIDGSSDYALYAYPAWSLERVYGRGEPRTDWGNRWQAAGDAVAWEGAARGNVGLLGEPRMIALKDSPIWSALGTGAGGYTDVLDTSVPPFAYGSGRAWIAVRRAAAEELGLLQGGDPGAPRVDLSPGDKEIADALKDLGEGFAADLLKELAA